MPVETYINTRTRSARVFMVFKGNSVGPEGFIVKTIADQLVSIRSNKTAYISGNKVA